MKWSIFGLLFFGVIAAAGAGLLVISLQAKGRPRVGGGDVELLVAAKNIEPGSLIKAEDVELKTVSRNDAPESYLSNPVQVIGRVPIVRMPKDRPFSKACLASEGSGLRVASVLENGMRAVTISLTDSSGLSGIIYAGSFVDVLATFTSGRGRSEAMTFPLLEKVNVLAVEGETVVSESKNLPEGKKARDTGGRKQLVTLMLDLRQASALQIASQYGVVSLALRNPMDSTPGKKEKIYLSRLLAGSSLPSALKEILGEKGAGLTPDEVLSTDPSEETAPKSAASKVSPRDTWDVTILRGSKSETKQFPLDVQGEDVNQENKVKA